MIIGGLQSLARLFPVENTMWCSVDMQHSCRDKVTDFGSSQLWGRRFEQCWVEILE